MTHYQTKTLSEVFQRSVLRFLLFKAILAVISLNYLSNEINTQNSHMVSYWGNLQAFWMRRSEFEIMPVNQKNSLKSV